MSKGLATHIAIGRLKKAEGQAPSSRYAFSNADRWDVALLTGATTHVGSVYNLSTTGIGILLDTALEPGSGLMLDLANRDSLLALRQEARIIHATPRAGGGYLVGCEFLAPLAYHQVRALIG